MANDSRVPYMGDTFRTNLLEYFVGEEVHLSTTVLGNRTILLAHIGTIAEQSCKNLVYYDFLLSHVN